MLLPPLSSHRQLKLTFPQSTKSPPLYREIREWVDGLVEGAKAVVTGEVSLTLSSALHVQHAIIACLITGRYLPPCRISVIRSVTHPSKVREGQGWQLYV